MCQPVADNAGRRHLRSAALGDLAVPATRTLLHGSRSFAAAGPSTWNSLPAPIPCYAVNITFWLIIIIIIIVINLTTGLVCDAVVRPDWKTSSRCNTRRSRITQKRNIFAGEMYSTICILDRWSFWSSFDVNRSTFDEDMRKNDFNIVVTSRWPWPLTFIHI